MLAAIPAKLTDLRRATVDSRLDGTGPLPNFHRILTVSRYLSQAAIKRAI